ncbi:MAG: hypothetical protein RLZZ127_144 [Planctomycetota bacterium]|jgi:signal transduction histidine kinase/DNA-binding response OmpR family regulator
MDPILVMAVGLAGAAAGAAGAAIIARRSAGAAAERLAALARTGRRLEGGEFGPSVAAGLADLGPVLGVDVLEWHLAEGDTMPVSALVAAWTAPGQRARLGDPLHVRRPWHPERSRWFARLCEGGLVAVDAASAPPAERPALDGLAALLLVPVRHEGRLVGVVLAGGRRAPGAGSALAALLDLFAEQAGAAWSRRVAAEALAAAELRAAAGDRARREFLANVSHELRTPLNGILGLTGLLADEDLSPRQRETAQVIRSSAENLHQLVNDILDIAATGGDRRLNPVRCDPLRLVEDVVVLQAESAFAKGLGIAVHPEPGLPARISCDAARLRQVVVNLVGNAIKFTHAGSVVVHVAWDPVGVLRIAVADTGAGMDPETAARIFADLTQGDAASTRRHGGLGIGLTVVRRQVAALRGTIRCDSQSGRGTTFHLTVPVETVSTAAPERLGAMQAAIAERRLLIVEPDPALRRAKIAQCALLRIQADGVAGCGEALDRLRQPGPGYDLGLVAATVPGAHDLPVAAGARTAWVLAVTAARRPARGEASARGFAATVVRPARLARLAAALRRALDPQREDSSDTHTQRVLRQTGLRVLVATDDPVARRGHRTALESAGLRVDAVTGIHEAIDAVIRLPYDAVLLDLAGDPEETFAAVGELRRIEALHGLGVMPVVAFVPARTPGIDSRAGRARLDAVLPRPAEPRELVRRLVQAVQTRRLTA